MNSLAVIQIYIVLLGFVAYILDAFAHSAETLLGQSIGNKDKSTSLVVIFKTFIFSLKYNLIFKRWDDLEKIIIKSDGSIIYD